MPPAAFRLTLGPWYFQERARFPPDSRLAAAARSPAPPQPPAPSRSRLRSRTPSAARRKPRSASPSTPQPVQATALATNLPCTALLLSSSRAWWAPEPLDLSLRLPVSGPTDRPRSPPAILI